MLAGAGLCYGAHHFMSQLDGAAEPTPSIPGRVERLAYRALLALIVVGVLARVVVIDISRGSTDMKWWVDFSHYINKHGLWQTYRDIGYFNHPPLMGLLAAGLGKVASLLHVPFRILWKLPPLCADLVALPLIWGYFRPRGRLWAAGAVALFSLNPVSISVTAFHGNTDSLCAVLCMAAALLHRRSLPFWAGFALAAACNVKVFPLVLAPALLLLLPELRSALRFLIGFGLGCAPLVIATAVVPDEFFRNTLHYNSQIDRWGLNAVALDASVQYTKFYRLITEKYREVGRFVILAVVGMYALLGRVARWDAVRVSSVCMAAFLFFAPGFGVQYLVWPVPLLALASLEYSAWWALLAGPLAVLIYQSYLVPNEWPLRSDHNPPFNPTLGLLGLCAWAVLGRYMYTELRAALREPPFVRVRRRIVELGLRSVTGQR